MAVAGGASTMTSSASLSFGSPAMCRPSRPRLSIRRDTSAALVVLYLRVTPERGSYVFRVRVPRGCCCCCVVVVVVSLGGGAAAVVVVEALDFRDDDDREVVGLVMWYLVVMRVW